MKALAKPHLLALLCLFVAASGQAQGTAFTYQGRLNQNGNPATGLYDLRFFVHDTPAGANSVAGPLALDGVGVTNGLFTVSLDFGAGVFTGPPRWLAIFVRTNGTVAYTNLLPRQPLTPAPYAIHAGTASNVVSGSVVKSLNNLRDNVSLIAGANVTVTPSGNTLTIAASGGVGGGPWALNGASAFYNGGPVGIGTTTPATRLTVSGSGGFNSPLAAAITLDNTAASRTWEWHALDDGRLQLADFTAGATRMIFDIDGNLGLGTLTPASKLDIAAQDALRITGFQPFITMSDSAGFGLIRKANRYLQIVDGDLAFLYRPECNVFPCNQATESHMTIRYNGLVGIGTSLPSAKLHLYNGPDSVSHRIETGAGINGWSRTEYANANGQWNVGTSRGFNGDQFYVHRQGSPAIAFAVQPNGDAYLQGTMNCRVLTITGGADLAEPFKMSSAEIPKGSVVVIDEENPGHLKLSTGAYDTRVAGIVSGANGIKPGISLHQEGTLEGGENVALSGRVYVHADATRGAIKPGDLLTTSDTPGHAMKVSDHARAQGAILGKAMTGLKDGKGMVLVLVTLQ